MKEISFNKYQDRIGFLDSIRSNIKNDLRIYVDTFLRLELDDKLCYPLEGVTDNFVDTKLMEYGK